MENRVCAKHTRIFCFNVCVCVNVSWRFCKWSGIAFTHGYVRKCVRRTCGRHFRTSQHQKSEGITGKDMIGWRSRCQRSSGWMCFGAKVAGRGTRPACAGRVPRSFARVSKRRHDWMAFKVPEVQMCLGDRVAGRGTVPRNWARHRPAQLRGTRAA